MAIQRILLMSLRLTLGPVLAVLAEVVQFYLSKLYHLVLGWRSLERHYRTLMDKASCYEQWAAAGYMLDRCQGKDRWKLQERSKFYDYGLVKDRLDNLRKARTLDNVELMFNLRQSIARNLGSFCD
jgi:hypothetical protein